MSGSLQTIDTATRTITAGAAAVEPVTFGYFPAEGSRTVTTQYAWGTQLGYVELCQRLVDLGMTTTPQSLYIDNSGVPNPVTLFIYGTGQVITVAAGTQGIFPAYFTDTPSFQITTPAPSAASTRVTLLNIPSGQTSWSAPTGSTGMDWSINPSAIPFGAFVQLLIVPARASRANITIQNQSANVVQVTRDDGISTGNRTSLFLAAATPAPVPAPGGAYTNNFFKGRYVLYGVLGSEIAVCED